MQDGTSSGGSCRSEGINSDSENLDRNFQDLASPSREVLTVMLYFLYSTIVRAFFNVRLAWCILCYTLTGLCSSQPINWLKKKPKVTSCPTTGKFITDKMLNCTIIIVYCSWFWILLKFLNPHHQRLFNLCQHNLHSSYHFSVNLCHQ